MKDSIFRRPTAVGCIFGLLSLASVPSRADVYLITNQVATVSDDDLRAIYSGDKEFIGSTKVHPVDNRAAQAEFLIKVLKLNPGRYDSLWTMKSFRDGLVAPTMKNSDSEVLAYLQSTSASIGYVSSPPPAGFTVLKKF